MSEATRKLLFEMPASQKACNQKKHVACRKPRLNKAQRDQIIFKELNIETLIPEDHPARAIWEFVGNMDIASFYLNINAVEGVAGDRKSVV